MSDVYYYLAGACWSLGFVGIMAAPVLWSVGRKRLSKALVYASVVLALGVFPLAELSASAQTSAGSHS